MLDKDASTKAFRRIFARHQIVVLDDLYRALDTDSRMSVFRRLRDIGYHSSYTHAGRYYTLENIPIFDDHGLWFHQGVGFSRYGTLKATIVEVVERADAGRMHGELGHLLRVRVQNALLDAVREGLVAREGVERLYVYVSADGLRAARQLEGRRAMIARARAATPLVPGMVIEVLAEVVQAAGLVVEPRVVVERLACRDMLVSLEQVEHVYREHGLVPGKKTRSRSSQR